MAKFQFINIYGKLWFGLQKMFWGSAGEKAGASLSDIYE